MKFPQVTSVRALLGISLLSVAPCLSIWSQTCEHPAEKQQLSRRMRGTEALAAAAVTLAECAKVNNLNEPALRDLLQKNHDLWLDQRGKLFFACEGLAFSPNSAQAAAVQAAVAAEVASSAIVPANTDAFKLHSLPGSNRVVYLDFTGHVTSGTAWNSSVTNGADIVSAPFDFDGDPTTFSAAERDRITKIWQRVVEDYAPFAIDITTEDPGIEALRRTSTADQNYGVRCVISPTSAWNPGAGGIAYVGSFTWNSDTPCFVFSNNLGPNSEKAVAEACSHEVGHTLGLSHDGLTDGTAYYAGQGDWAPIMGVSYYRPISQWSKGEYANANNKEDDLAVMQRFGAVLLADDHGDTMASATVVSGTSVREIGIIGTRTDVDMFRFDVGAGAISLSLVGTSPQPDLDIKADLLDANGNVVTSSDPAGLSASISATLAAGTYYLRVDGVGVGDPATTGYSDYASSGEYLITGTLPSGGVTPPPPTNQPPVARATATPTSGTSPLTVAFSSGGSTDSDGTVASTSWNFGDGSSSTQASPGHVYTVAGNYSAVLTVTDNAGATSTSSVSIVVSPASAAGTLDVSSFTLTPTRTAAGSTITSIVQILDQAQKPVAGVNLSLRWTGVFFGTLNRTTDVNGEIHFTTQRTARAGNVTVVISALTPPSGFAFNPNLFTEPLTETVTINR